MHGLVFMSRVGTATTAGIKTEMLGGKTGADYVLGDIILESDIVIF